MKLLLNILLITFSLSLSASFLSSSERTLKNDLKDLLNNDLYDSDGRVSSLACSGYYSGIVCKADLEFVDIGSFQSGNDGSASKCVETYYYDGHSSLKTLCSTCWYNDDQPFFSQSCEE